MRTAVVLLFVLVCAAPAGAAQVSATTTGDATSVTVTDTAGEANAMAVTFTEPDEPSLTVTDTAAPPTAGDGCVQVATDAVQCALAPRVTGAPVFEDVLHVALGGGDDTLTLDNNGLKVDVDGGAGNDTLTFNGPGSFRNYPTFHGGAGDDTINAPIAYGDAGNDTLTVSPAEALARLRGGAGDDTFLGVSPSGALFGGAGTDTLDDSASSTPLSVDLTGAEPSTPQGFDSSYTKGIENVIGSRKGDVILGDKGPNRLDGGPGNDVIDLGRGPSGTDYLDAGAGNDRILHADAHTHVACGPGRDTVAELEGPAQLIGCERVHPFRRP